MADSDEESAENNRGGPSPIFTAPGHGEGWTNCIAWLPDDRIITGSNDGTLRIWNLSTGTQEVRSMVHPGRGLVVGVITTTDGRIISCATEDKRLRVWNTDAEELTNGPWSTEDYGPALCMALSQNEELLASYHEKGIIIWEMAGTMRIRNFISHDSIGGFRYAKSACFSPDGDKLAICAHDWSFIVLDAASGETIFGPLDPEDFLGFRVAIWSSEQSDRLFCACRDPWIRLLDSSTGQIISKLRNGHDSSPPALCLSLAPDGKWFASGSFSRSVILWNVAACSPIGEPLNHCSYVMAVAFSHSGEFVACTGDKGKISAWRVPWWDNNNRKTDSILEQSAVISPDVPSNIARESDFDFLDAPASRRQRSLQDHSRTNPSEPPPRVQRSKPSWRWWKMIPRFVHDRSHPIYMGWAEPRTHVASRSTISNDSDPSSPSDSAPTPPLMVVEESVSEESSEESGNDSITEPEVSQIGCCGLLSRRRPRASPAREREQSSLRNNPPSSTNAGIPTHPPPRPAAQDILELSAVV